MRGVLMMCGMAWIDVDNAIWLIFFFNSLIFTHKFESFFFTIYVLFDISFHDIPITVKNFKSSKIKN